MPFLPRTTGRNHRSMIQITRQIQLPQQVRPSPQLKSLFWPLSSILCPGTLRAADDCWPSCCTQRLNHYWSAASWRRPQKTLDRSDVPGRSSVACSNDSKPKTILSTAITEFGWFMDTPDHVFSIQSPPGIRVVR